MPVHFTGTPAERIKRLEKQGRRCIGQNGRCVTPAVDEFDVIPMVNEQPDHDAPIETRKVCGRHRLVVIANEKVHIVVHRRAVLTTARPAA